MDIALAEFDFQCRRKSFLVADIAIFHRMFRGAERKRFMYRRIFLAVIGQCDFCPPYTGLNTYYSFDHFHFLLNIFSERFSLENVQK